MPEPLAVAAAESVMDVEEAMVATVVPAVIPGPITLIPTKIPVVLGSPEIVVELVVKSPAMVRVAGYEKSRDVPVAVTVAAFERMIAVDVTTASTVVPGGIPGPITPIPTSNASVLAKFEILVEPLVVSPAATMMAGLVKITEMPEAVAVAAEERMMEDDETMEVTFAPNGIPGPLTPMPTARLAVLARLESVFDPLVVLPVVAIEEG